ncbi:MAG: alpha/beta fold hydrolase [Promethearchaeota archaeon]
MNFEEFKKKSLIVENNSIIYLDNEADSNFVLVLVHGWMERKEHWSLVIQNLSENIGKNRIIIPDLRGHGESEKKRESTYRVEDFYNDILAIIAHEALSEKHLVFVGHSYGGVITLFAAKKLEETTRGVFVINTEFVSNKRFGETAFLSLLTYIFSSTKRFTANQLKKQASFNPEDPSILSLYAESIRLTPRFVARRLSLDMLRTSLPQVSFPIVVITGQLDRLVPPHTGENFRNVTSSSFKHITLENVGHYTPLVAPQRIAQIIEDEGFRLKIL